MLNLRAFGRGGGGQQVGTRATPSTTTIPRCVAGSWPVRCARGLEEHRRACILDASPAASALLRQARLRRRRRGAVAADDAATTTTPEQQLAADQAAVSTLLGWAQANGVDISRAGVFVEPNGERGLIAAQAVGAKGDPLLVVPLRLALVDDGGGGGSYDGAPWSVRLASRLLRELGMGAQSPWSAYVGALPRRVPAASATWTWDQVRRLRDPPCESGVHAASWLADDSFERLSPRAAEVWGPAVAALDPEAMRERWGWALGCVHSRTLLVRSEGGLGARAMVPLIDLANHACDQAGRPRGGGAASSCSFGRAAAEGARARDNVRWDLVGGGESGQAWALALTALRPLAQGEELLLSYGERSNDDFLTHYGFVPTLNPHDDVELFSAGEAAEAAAAATATGGEGPGQDARRPPSSKEEAVAQSRAAAEAALEEAAEWHWAQRRRRRGGDGEDEGEGEAAAAERLYRAAIARAVEAEVAEQGGGRAPGDKRGLRVAAGSRVSPGLVALFAELERDAQEQQQEGRPQRAAAERLVARRCWQLLRERELVLLRDLAALALAEAEEEDEEEERPFSSWLLPYYYRTLVVERGLCGPDGAWEGVAGAVAAADDGRALARRILGVGGGAGAAVAEIPDNEARLATAFRAYKAMILADCVVESGASLRELE